MIPSVTELSSGHERTSQPTHGAEQDAGAQDHAQVLGCPVGSHKPAPLNTYLVALRKLMLDKTAAPILEELMGLPALRHVATYVVTTRADMLVLKKNVTVKKKKKTAYRSFGGCDYPNSIVRMINSLRIELADESGLIPRAELKPLFSPLCVFR